MGLKLSYRVPFSARSISRDTLLPVPNQLVDPSVPAEVANWAQKTLPPNLAFAAAPSAEAPDPKIRREKEFELGRSLGKKLLDKIGVSGAIETNEDRSPAWPPGIAGSISHSRNWTWVAAAKTSQIVSVGIDTEPTATDSTRQEIESRIATESEWKIVDQLGLPADLTFTLVFAAKEAFYKCYYPVDQQFFDFDEAQVIKVNEDSLRIRKLGDTGVLPPELEVRYFIFEGNAFAATWILPSEVA